MAIRLQNRKDMSRIEFIAEADEAIDHKDSECSYEEYLKTGDESKLRFKPDLQPTRFILNFELKGKDAERVKNAAMSGKDLDGKTALSIGTLMFTLAKLSIKSIQYAPDEPLETQIILKKDDRGNVHDDTLALLDRYGILDGIWSLYGNLVLTPSKAASKNS